MQSILISLTLLSALCSASATADGKGPLITTAEDSEVEIGRSKDPMQELLHWAVQHSDPDKLAELMLKYKDQNLTLKDVYGEDMLESMFVDEAGLMETSIHTVSDFRNGELQDEHLQEALMRLLDLVEQVDNALNLHKLGGLLPLLDLAAAADVRSASVRASALWTFGVAVQNNAPVQEAVQDLGVLEKLAGLLPICGTVEPWSQDMHESDDICSKLLFAISSLVRNSAVMQEQFDQLGGFDWLVDVGLDHPSIAVAKKSMALLDTVIAQNPDLPFVAGLSARGGKISNVLLARIKGVGKEQNIEASEKALELVLQLLEVRPSLFGQDFTQTLQSVLHETVTRCEASRAPEDEGICDLLSGSDIANPTSSLQMLSI